MSRGVNKCIFIGNLGKDPEYRTFANGGAVCNATMACNESWKDREGKPQERTEWVNLVFSNKLADVAREYLRKGSKIYIEGKLRTRKYESQGQDRYITEVNVDQMIMLDGRQEGQESRQEPRGERPTRKPAETSNAAPASAQAGGQAGFEDDDIPF